MAGSAQSLVPALRSLLACRRASDGDLLDRFARCRDEDAFGELVGRHGPMVLGVGRRVSRDAHAAEDVFQATFLLLARKATTIRRPEGLAGWLHQTAFRLALRARRRAPQQAAHSPRSAASPLDTLTARELLGVIDEELSRLPEEQRQAVVLCCLEGQSLEEASQQLGCGVGAVKGRLERGRARLRQQLERRGLTLPAVFVAPLLGEAAVPSALVQLTRTAVFEGAAGPSVLALTGGTMPVTALRLVLCGVVLLCGAIGAAALFPESRPAEHAAPPPAVAVEEPLPAGARLRLGDVERRAAGAKFAITADGKSVVVAHRRSAKAITEYDAATGKVVGRRDIPQEHLGGLWQLSPDGRWLATAQQTAQQRPGFMHHINVWDTRTGKRAGQMSITGSYSVPLGSFSADGTRLAVLGMEALKRRIYVWEWQKGTQLLAASTDGQQECYQVALSPDGRHALLFPDAESHGILCWEVAGGKLLWRRRGTGEMLVTPNGKVLSREGTPAFVERDLHSGEVTTTLRLPATFGHRVAISGDGRRLAEVASGGDGGVWDLQSGKKVGRFPNVNSDLLLTPDGKSVVTNEGSLQRYDLATGKPSFPEESARGHLDEITRLVFSADGQRLGAASRDGSVGVWEPAAGRPIFLRRMHVPRGPALQGWGWTSGGGEAFDMSADGRWLASCDLTNVCRVVDVAGGKVVCTFRFPAGRPRGPHCSLHQLLLDPGAGVVTGLFAPTYMPSGERAIGQLIRWGIAPSRLVSKDDVAGVMPSGGAIDPTGRFFVCAGRVHDAHTGQPVVELAGCDARSDACLSLDSLLIAGGPTRRDPEQPSGLAKTPVRVWEAATGKLVVQLPTFLVPGDKVFHPGGRFLAWNDTNALRAWDLQTGRVVKTWAMPEEVSLDGRNRVSCFAFSPDGRTLATGHPDGTILLWDAALPAARPEPLRPGERETLWTQLADDDAGKAYQAVWRLAEFPAEAVALIRERLKPAQPPKAETMRKLIAELDGDTKAVRDAATEALRKHGAGAEAALRESLKTSVSAEQKRRLQQLLAELEKPKALTGGEARDLRALAVLAAIGTPEARAVLKGLADGVATDRVTRQAKAILDRRR